MELETTIQRNKENLEQALMTERERVTQMQRDMEELRQKSFKMELKLKSKEVMNCFILVTFCPEPSKFTLSSNVVISSSKEAC